MISAKVMFETTAPDGVTAVFGLAHPHRSISVLGAVLEVIPNRVVDRAMEGLLFGVP
jgi:hypothetical protein